MNQSNDVMRLIMKLQATVFTAEAILSELYILVAPEIRDTDRNGNHVRLIRDQDAPSDFA